MATQSPFSFLEGLLPPLPIPLEPPAWVIEETHRRVVLLLNHVLMREPHAMQRLVKQKGRVLLVQWRHFAFKVRITPAGLLDVADTADTPDLTLGVTQDSPFAIAQSLLQGDKPAVRIEGDVHMAAELNWVVDNVRWDLEEDLAKIIGDVPAHTVGQAARAAVQALQQFARSVMGGAQNGRTP